MQGLPEQEGKEASASGLTILKKASTFTKTTEFAKIEGQKLLLGT